MEGTAALAVVAAGAGAAAGSFSGVVASRGWRGALRGRSCCDGCSRTLGWSELVPVASWLLLRGRCRTCRAAIPRSAFLREVAGALTGAAVVVAATAQGWR